VRIFANILKNYNICDKKCVIKIYKNIIYNIYKLNRKDIALILKNNSSFIIKKIIYVEDLQIYIYYTYLLYIYYLQIYIYYRLHGLFL